MNGLQDMVLIGEIVLQSKIANRAAVRLKATHQKFDNVETWCSIQSILVAVGNVSKILWPGNPKYKLRGVNLRCLLNVKDDSPLSSRKFRNHFEHYDERVDSWFESCPYGVYIDLAMNPSLKVEGFPDEEMNAHRGYNSFNNTVVFRGETLELDPVMIALEILCENCKLYVL